MKIDTKRQLIDYSVADTLSIPSGGLTVTAGGLTVTAGGLTITAGGLTVTAGAVIIPTATPAANATGVAGSIAWDASYIYVCTATNTWERVALTGSY